MSNRELYLSYLTCWF